MSISTPLIERKHSADQPLKDAQWRKGRYGFREQENAHLTSRSTESRMRVPGTVCPDQSLSFSNSALGPSSSVVGPNSCCSEKRRFPNKSAALRLHLLCFTALCMGFTVRGWGNDWCTTLTKITVDSVLFANNFSIQFRGRPRRRSEERN